MGYEGLKTGIITAATVGYNALGGWLIHCGINEPDGFYKGLGIGCGCVCVVLGEGLGFEAVRRIRKKHGGFRQAAQELRLNSYKLQYPIL